MLQSRKSMKRQCALWVVLVGVIALGVHLSTHLFVLDAYAALSVNDKKGKDKKDKDNKDKKDEREKEVKNKKDKQPKKADPADTVRNQEKKKAVVAPPPATEKIAPVAGALSQPAASSNSAVAPAVVPPPVLNKDEALAPTKVEAVPVTENQSAKKPDGKGGAEKAVEDGSDTFRISSNLVAVPVSVTDSNGEPVRNLKADEFKLDEEGERQQVQSLGEPGKTPLELTLLFDVSGSVFERFDFQKQAASRFLKQVLKPNDVVSVFLIGFEGKLVIPRTRNFPQVISDLMAMQPTKEGTAFHASVVRAANYLNDNAETGSRRVMVVISDGEDNFSKTVSLVDAQRELQRSDMVFYSINPSGPSIKLNRISMKGQNAMLSLANETGGVAFLPDKEEELDRVFRQIAAELQAQYLLGYYSTNEANDGKFRRIQIQLPQRAELRIRARQGYYPPKDN